MNKNIIPAPSKAVKKQGKKSRKYGRNRVKCARYRARVGKPHREGNKRGKNKRA
jgi:hypothetical protein